MQDVWWNDTVNRRVIRFLVLAQIILFWEAFKNLGTVGVLLSMGLRLDDLAPSGEPSRHLWIGLLSAVVAGLSVGIVRQLRSRESKPRFA